MDGKRFALCLFGRIWILPAAAAGCALFAALIYWIVVVGLAGAPEYQVFSQYRIYFDSEKYGQIEDYYNAYTWGEIMKTDQVVDFVMEALPEGITKEPVSYTHLSEWNGRYAMPLKFPGRGEIRLCLRNCSATAASRERRAPPTANI